MSPARAFGSSLSSAPSRAEQAWRAVLDADADPRAALAKAAVPPSLRPEVWLRFSGAGAAKRDGVYGEVLARAEARPRSDDAGQIDLDVVRSGFPGDAAQGRLRRVLRSYATFRPDCGYVQGQNFVAAALLRGGCTEEQAFWLLAVVVDAYLPLHYTDRMEGSFTDCRVLSELLGEAQPEVAAKLRALDVDVAPLASRWFLCLWSSILAPEPLLRTYDALFVLGPTATLHAGLATLAALGPHIAAAKHADELSPTRTPGARRSRRHGTGPRAHRSSSDRSATRTSSAARCSSGLPSRPARRSARAALAAPAVPQPRHHAPRAGVDAVAPPRADQRRERGVVEHAAPDAAERRRDRRRAARRHAPDADHERAQLRHGLRRLALVAQVGAELDAQVLVEHGAREVDVGAVGAERHDDALELRARPAPAAAVDDRRRRLAQTQPLTPRAR